MFRQSLYVTLSQVSGQALVDLLNHAKENGSLELMEIGEKWLEKAEKGRGSVYTMFLPPGQKPSV